MTYVVAVKCGNSVLLAADTVVTATSPFGIDHEAGVSRTSFGELSISEENRFVSESSLKIFHLGKIAVAFSGNVATGQSVLEELRFEIEATPNPREAVVKCVKRLESSTLRRIATFAVGIPSKAGVSLLVFDSVNREIRESANNEVLQLGSMPAHFRQCTNSFMDKFVPYLQTSPNRLLAVLLGILQSYGTFSHLLENGVGGAFTGLHIGEKEINWQDDICYVVHAGPEKATDFVHCAIRDNVLIVNSSIIGECRYFLGKFNCPNRTAWKEKWWDSASYEVTKAEFGFVSYLNKQHRITAIIEMAGHSESKSVQFAPKIEATPTPLFKLNMTTSPKIHDLATIPLTEDNNTWKVVWKPFEPFSGIQTSPSTGVPKSQE